MSVKATAVHAYLLDPLERAASTFVQQFVVMLMVGSSAALLVTQNYIVAVDTAGFAAIISLLTSAATFAVPKLSAGPDLILRVLKTGLQSFLGSLTASVVAPSVVHAPWTGSLAIAFPVMMAALLKGLASFAAPWSEGASLIPLHASLYQHDGFDPDLDVLPPSAAAGATNVDPTAAQAVASGVGQTGSAGTPPVG